MPGYISEVDYDGGAASNFVEIVVPASVDTSAYRLVIYTKNGEVDETFELGDPVNSISGKNVFLVDSATSGWIDLKNNEAVALVDDNGEVLQFIAFKDPVTATEGPAAGQSAVQIGEHSGGNKSLVTSDGGNSYSPTPSSSKGTVPCYAPGTLIDTENGPQPIECLRSGDRVATLDRGPQTIRWVNVSRHALDSNADNGAQILIAADALGRGRPARDLIVSPQHRVLAGGEGQLQAAFPVPVLVPAKALTGLPRIRAMRGQRAVTWVHFACDAHQIVQANGCWSESLLLGPMVMNALNRRQSHEITRLFAPTPPDRASKAPPNGLPARACLTVGAVRRLLAHHDTGLTPAPGSMGKRPHRTRRGDLHAIGA